MMTINASGQLANAEAFSGIIVTQRNGTPVRLDEIATVIDSVEDDKAAAAMYLGIARFYEQIAAALEAPQPGDAIAQLNDFCVEPAKRKSA